MFTCSQPTGVAAERFVRVPITVIIEAIALFILGLRCVTRCQTGLRTASGSLTRANPVALAAIRSEAQLNGIVGACTCAVREHTLLAEAPLSRGHLGALIIHRAVTIFLAVGSTEISSVTVVDTDILASSGGTVVVGHTGQANM
jgi:hypothetical protein